MAKVYNFEEMRGQTMDRITINDVAKTLLTFESMTHKKLQKLCYYTYAWYLTLYNERLCNTYFEAWIHGPVSPELYQDYKGCGWQLIPKLPSVPASVKGRYLDHIINVYESYGDLTGDELEALTHQEEPWLNARSGLEEWQPSSATIKDSDMLKYYSLVFENGQND